MQSVESLSPAVSDGGKDGPSDDERTRDYAAGYTAALVLGQWSLARESEPLSGNFSLVLRKIGDRWVIVHDHTSRAEG